MRVMRILRNWQQW
uniref:Truncated envelope glycoprotein n=1 Tax=Human immunodeficiency virus type 1 TaxID=11676 RepID=A0A0H3YCZ8_HV1|nr:truncated envelope glycoprotein [Human immunodeficiency virus 1]